MPLSQQASEKNFTRVNPLRFSTGTCQLCTSTDWGPYRRRINSKTLYFLSRLSTRIHAKYIHRILCFNSHLFSIPIIHKTNKSFRDTVTLRIHIQRCLFLLHHNLSMVLFRRFTVFIHHLLH